MGTVVSDMLITASARWWPEWWEIKQKHKERHSSSRLAFSALLQHQFEVILLCILYSTCITCMLENVIDLHFHLITFRLIRTHLVWSVGFKDQGQMWSLKVGNILNQEIFLMSLSVIWPYVLLHLIVKHLKAHLQGDKSTSYEEEGKKWLFCLFLLAFVSLLCVPWNRKTWS